MSAEDREKGLTPTIKVCPSCGESGPRRVVNCPMGVRARTDKDYHCPECGHVFDEPDERPRGHHHDTRHGMPARLAELEPDDVPVTDGGIDLPTWGECDAHEVPAPFEVVLETMDQVSVEFECASADCDETRTISQARFAYLLHQGGHDRDQLREVVRTSGVTA